MTLLEFSKNGLVFFTKLIEFTENLFGKTQIWFRLPGILCNDDRSMWQKYMHPGTVKFMLKASVLYHFSNYMESKNFCQCDLAEIIFKMSPQSYSNNVLIIFRINVTNEYCLHVWQFNDSAMSEQVEKLQLLYCDQLNRWLRVITMLHCKAIIKSYDRLSSNRRVIIS